MGMFDWVTVEVDLPDGWEPRGQLQSKDLDCDMTIVKVGPRLLVERFENYTVPKEERPYPDAPDGSIKALAGSWGRRNRRWEDLAFHGHFNFYGDEERDGEHIWHEYLAKYTDGDLVEITLLRGPTLSD